jgi:hypothetical protein
MGPKQHARNQLRAVMMFCGPWFLAALPGTIGQLLKGDSRDPFEILVLVWSSFPLGLIFGSWVNLLLTTEPKPTAPATHSAAGERG